MRIYLFLQERLIQRTRNEELAELQSAKTRAGNPAECTSYDCIITGLTKDLCS